MADQADWIFCPHLVDGKGHIHMAFVLPGKPEKTLVVCQYCYAEIQREVIENLKTITVKTR